MSAAFYTEELAPIAIFNIYITYARQTFILTLMKRVKMKTNKQMCFWDAIELWTLTRPLQSSALSSISDTPFLRILSNTWRNVSSSWLREARSSVVTIGTLSILILVDFGGMWTKRLFSLPLPFPLPFSLFYFDAKERRIAQINNHVSIWVFFFNLLSQSV